MANPLDLVMQQQDQCNWCWAAVASSVSTFMSPQSPMTQCQVASVYWGTPGDGCCNDGHTIGGCDKNDCNRTAYLENALYVVKHLRRSQSNQPNPAPGIPSQSMVIQEIDAQRPIGGKIQWSDGQPQAHFVLITGYELQGSIFVVHVCDPEKPDGTIPSDFPLDGLAAGGYQGLQGSGSWIESYFTT
jgi:hypothetical protein